MSTSSIVTERKTTAKQPGGLDAIKERQNANVTMEHKLWSSVRRVHQSYCRLHIHFVLIVLLCVLVCFVFSRWPTNINKLIAFYYHSNEGLCIFCVVARRYSRLLKNYNSIIPAAVSLNSHSHFYLHKYISPLLGGN